MRWTIVVLLAACSREPKPHLTVEPERLDLGRMSPGDSYQGRLRLLSNGDAPLLIDMIVASNQRISIDALQGIELPPGGSMEARVGFDAIEPGAIDAHVTIVSSAGVTEVPITGIVESLEQKDGGQPDGSEPDASEPDADLPDAADPDAAEDPDATPCVPAFGNPIPLAGTSTNAGLEDSPTVATDGNGAWVSLFASDDDLGGTIGADPDMFVSRSTDGAAWSFAAPLSLSQAQGDGAEADEVPSLAYGGGAWIATWQADINNTDPRARIFTALSFDGGRTFTAPSELLIEQDDSVPAVITDGVSVVLAWHAHESLIGTTGDDGDILFVRSIDMGQSWSPIGFINDHATVDGAWDGDVSLGVLGPGEFIAVWTTNHDGPGFGPDDDVLFSRSFDGGMSWEPARPLFANALEMDDEHEPALATDRAGRIVVAWPVADAPETLIVAASSDGGDTWISQPLATGAPSDAYPTIATDGRGTFLVAWHTHEDVMGSGTDGDIRGSVSLDGGLTWEAPIFLNSNAIGDSGDDQSPHLASDGRQWLMIYQSTAPRDLLYVSRALCE